ncbi:MAG TPA: RNA polymerase sigma factor [Gemmatimonadaceae bacterium]|nr:RNA polymerase sigma factor [Gemmatimonadaceae bacterium]
MTDANSSGDERGDQELIDAWRGGDQRAASVLVTRHAPAVARFVASRGERQDVDEVVQDTFVRAFGAVGAFRGDSSLRTWLFAIARRLMLDRRRAEKRQRLQVEIAEDDAATEYDALDGVVADETQARLRGALDGLSPRQREVFTLRVNDGLTYKEIADLVGTTEGAARVHYHNAVHCLKELLDD